VAKIIKRINWILLTCVLLGLFAVPFFYFQNPAGGQDGEEPVQRLSSGKSLFYIKGYSMTQYAGERVVRIEADELKVIPKKFKVFNFKPFNEMVLKSPRITTYRRSGGSETSKLNSAGDERGFFFPRVELPTNNFNPNGIKMISGVHLDGLSWLIMEDEKEFVRCRARQAYLNITKSELELDDLELENVGLGRRIAAKKGCLDLKSKLVKISASAVTHTQAVSVKGNSIQLDLNLNQAPL
jgi:hypothetical protein